MNRNSRAYGLTRILPAVFMLVLALTLSQLAFASAGAVELTYVYSHECLACEQAWPLVEKATNQSPVPVTISRVELNTREGVTFTRERGITSVPTVVVDGAIISLIDYDGLPAYEQAVRDALNPEKRTAIPVAITRNVAGKRHASTPVTVDTNITCRGSDPVYVNVKGGIPESAVVTAGETEWSGTLQPGESRRITSTCQIPENVSVMPPPVVTYDDGSGLRTVTGPEIPLAIVRQLSALTVFAAGLIAGINPCLLAVLAFIAGTTIADTGRRTVIMARILAFSAGLLVTYLLIGLGLMEIVRLMPGIELYVRMAVIASLALFAGWLFYDAWRTRQGSEGKVYKNIIRRLSPLYQRYGLLISIALGAAFGLVKMPCVGGVYIAILGSILESGETASGIFHLFVYNLGVITPVLLIGAIVTLGMSPGKVNEFRLRYRIWLKIFSALLLALLALGIATGVM